MNALTEADRERLATWLTDSNAAHDVLAQRTTDPGEALTELAELLKKDPTC